MFQLNYFYIYGFANFNLFLNLCYTHQIWMCPYALDINLYRWCWVSHSTIINVSNDVSVSFQNGEGSVSVVDLGVTRVDHSE